MMLRSHGEDFVVLLAASLAFAGMIAYGHGIPYVLDGNETFSALVHARNLLNFDFSLAKGLADETFSAASAAHPFVHTHQGNFPRLFAAALYFLGAKSPEAQIAATASTVGLASMLLLFRTCRNEFGRAIAFVAIALLLTDYAMFLQWHLVTYRVWHGFFAGACLFAVSAYARTGRKGWFAAFFIVWYFLFYYELAFAVFMATTVGMWTIWKLKDAPKTAAVAVGVQFLGSVCGAATVVVQIVAYLGWNGFLQDLSLTYAARNAAIDPSTTTAAIERFASQHHVALFHNMVDGSLYRTLHFAVESLTTWGVQVYSPGLSLLLTTFAVAALLSAVPGRVTFERMAARPLAMAGAGLLAWMFPGLMGSLAGCLLCGVASLRPVLAEADRGRPSPAQRTFLLWIVWFGSLFLDGRVLGEMSVSSGAFSPVFAIGATVAASLVAAWGLDRLIAGRKSPLPEEAVGRAALLLVLLSMLAGITGEFAQSASPVFWSNTLFHDPAVYGALVRGSLGLAGFLAVAFLARREGASSANPPHPREPRIEAGALMTCAVSGLLTVIILMPGYVYSGYMVRNLSFMVPFFALFSAIGLVWLACEGLDAVQKAGVGAAGMPLLFRMVGGGGIAVVVFAAAGWLAVQGTLATLVPAGEFAGLIRALREHQGATVVSNTYAAPFFVATGGWAYLDGRIGRAEVVKTPEGYDYVRDKSYLWFADRETNPAYDRPDLYVCYADRRHLAILKSRALPDPANRDVDMKTSCERDQLVAMARRGERTAEGPRLKILAEDPNGGKDWAIVAFDYDWPPFLAAPPKIEVHRAGSQVVFDVRYDFAQQDGVPEDHTDVAVFAVQDRAGGCLVSRPPLAAARVHGGHALVEFPLADLPPEMVAVIGVTPATATRGGAVAYATLGADGSIRPQASPCVVSDFSPIAMTRGEKP